MPRNNERFSTKLPTARILAEHFIGFLKRRFPWIRSIRNKLIYDKESIRILKLIECCVIIHNLMIPEDGAEDLLWYFYDGYTSDVDDNSRCPGLTDQLYRPITPGSTKDERRRRLQKYMEQTEYCPTW